MGHWVGLLPSLNVVRAARYHHRYEWQASHTRAEQHCLLQIILPERRETIMTTHAHARTLGARSAKSQAQHTATPHELSCTHPRCCRDQVVIRVQDPRVRAEVCELQQQFMHRSWGRLFLLLFPRLGDLDLPIHFTWSLGFDAASGLLN